MKVFDTSIRQDASISFAKTKATFAQVHPNKKIVQLML